MNDLRRLILATLLVVIGMMLWNAWTAEHAPRVMPGPVIPAAGAGATSTLPAAVTATGATSGPTSVPPASQRYIHITTDTLDATIDRVGGNLVSVKLIHYPVSINQPHQPIALLNNAPATYYVANSGFRSSALPSNQTMVFSSAQQNYQLSAGAPAVNVTLTWHNAAGLRVTKIYTFPANTYLIHLSQQLNNQSKAAWQGQFFAELQRKPVNAGGLGPFHFNTYLGGAISSPQERYQKISFKKMQEKNIDVSIQNGWLAMIQHYFLSAWIPSPTENFHYYSQASNDIYTLGLESYPVNIASGQHYQTGARLYVGPEIADQLAQIAPGLKLTVDYGILWFIAVIIFWWMKKIYLVTGNWGWAIVLVTLTIKLLFYKLNATSFRSMAAMRALQPLMQQLRERYGDDRQKMAQATMELYKREKVNPLGGCLPLIVQIPVFLALYWVLAESVELRQAPFILWIHDLSAKDPYYVLPLLMGLTIFIQQWLAPKPPDPMQRNLMLAMPVVFTALFLSFPAGLVLYWVVNNSLSILQQWYIMKYVVPQRPVMPTPKTPAAKALPHERK